MAGNLGAKRCIFQYTIFVMNSKSNLDCEVGCGLTVLCSDQARIIIGLSPYSKPWGTGIDPNQYCKTNVD